MRQKFTIYNRDGEIVEDDDGIMKDGEVLRVPVTLTDGAPRFFMQDSAADSARRERLLDAYEARDARLTSAWKDAPPVVQPAKIPAQPGDRVAAYEARDARLVAAWRHPV